jgi:pimeloyl-ACP methyl ester carboxylesterase/pterin-4a-carbinolamine dehydratase
MDIILVPGLWLDGSSWERVVPGLELAGHRAHPLTLPGMESRDADRSGITLDDHVEAVVEAIDSLDPARGKVVLVGHSGGCGIAYAAVDVRPDRVALAVYVGGFPVGDGGAIADGYPAENGEVPLPDWSEFEEEDLVDLDDEGRRAFRDRAVPSPAHVTGDPQRLSDDERRYQVPVTVIATEFTGEMLRDWIERGLAPVRELTRIRDVEYVDLPTGHWPQFTRPEDLAGAILASIDGAARRQPPGRPVAAGPGGMGGRISPRQFSEADGVEDWRVLGEGACAYFRTGSFVAGARLVHAIGELAGLGEHHPDLDLRHEGVTVRLLTTADDWYGLTERDLDLARQISAVARQLGLSADPSALQTVQVSIDALVGSEVMPFWRAVLGYEHRPDSPDEDLIDPRGRGPSLWFQEMDAPRPQRNRIHIDVWVPHDQAEARVRAAIAAGGRLVTDEHAPGWWTLADPEGNEVDVATWMDHD